MQEKHQNVVFQIEWIIDCIKTISTSGVENINLFYDNSNSLTKQYTDINRPDVAGAVLQSPLSLIDSFIDSSIQKSVSSKPPKHHYTQKIRVRELRFWKNVHPQPCVTCHMLRGQSSEASRWRFCYQRGLPRLVYNELKENIYCIGLLWKFYCELKASTE